MSQFPRPPLMALDDALAVLLDTVAPVWPSERVTTFEADGRVLARTVVSGLHVPPHDNSSMDGYAVRLADLALATTDQVVELPVAQRIAAGHVGTVLQPRTVARIFTGAPVPQGADAVVMQEDVTLLERDGMAFARFQSPPAVGAWIRRAGEDVKRGEPLLLAGRRLGPAELGLAASLGLAELEVACRPRVALLSTGDELVMPGTVPPEAMPPGAIYNSNRFFLKALLKRFGCVVTDLGIVPDQRDATVAALADAARTHDVILTSGGVSVGEEDHIKPAVERLGALGLWQIGMKPGKPFAHGHVNRPVQSDRADAPGAAHFIGLPGNPVSSFVTFLLLVRPFLLRMQGVQDVSCPSIRLPAHFAVPKADKRREFLRVRRNSQGGLDLFPNQSSGVLTSAAWGDGVVDNPAGQVIAHGDMVRYLSFADLMA